MTERLAETTRRIENLRQLEAVVTAMRGIAASRAQQARGLLPGLRTHAVVITCAIDQALALLPEERRPARAGARRAAVILFCAEQGFVGAFSERMLESAGTGADGSDLFLIGTRGAVLAEARRIHIAWRAAMAPAHEPRAGPG